MHLPIPFFAGACIPVVTNCLPRLLAQPRAQLAASGLALQPSQQKPSRQLFSYFHPFFAQLIFWRHSRPNPLALDQMGTACLWASWPLRRSGCILIACTIYHSSAGADDVYGQFVSFFLSFPSTYSTISVSECSMKFSGTTSLSVEQATPRWRCILCPRIASVRRSV